MARKKGRWQDKLNKAERKHLRETGARTLALVKSNVDFQDQNECPCWDCVGIGRKLGMEIRLTAFDNRCREMNIKSLREEKDRLMDRINEIDGLIEIKERG